MINEGSRLLDKSLISEDGTTIGVLFIILNCGAYFRKTNLKVFMYYVILRRCFCTFALIYCLLLFIFGCQSKKKINTNDFSP